MRHLLPIGLVGSALTALCCVTPLLPLVLTGLGLGAWIGTLYRDAVLLPLLGLFLVLTGAALWSRRRRTK